MSEIEMLQALHQRAQFLRFQDFGELDDIVRKSKMVLQNLFPLKSYDIDVTQIHFHPSVIGQVSPYLEQSAWNSGQVQLVNLLDTAIKDFVLQQARTSSQPKEIIRERIVTVQDNAAIDNLNLQFIEYKKSVKKWSVFGMILLFSSTLIWIFFFTSGWTWYLNHPKRLSITLMLNLTVCIALLNIPLKNKWLIWVPIVAAAIIGLIALI
jgi:hypothetical protein